VTNLLHVAVILVCLVGSALFAGLETGVISIHRLRLRHLVRTNTPGARIIERFLNHPDHLLGTTLVGNNLCLVFTSVTTAILALKWFGAWGPWISSIFTSLIILVVGEYLPKAWFQGRPAHRTLPFARFLQIAGWVFLPLSRAAMWIARWLFPAPRDARDPDRPFITKEEIKHLAHEGVSSGELTKDEQVMIHSVLELEQTTCRQIMTPATRMVRVSDEDSSEELLDVARSHHYSRLPVYSEDEQRFIGIVHVLDILRDPDPAGKTARDYMRPPQFVSASLPADELLPRMRLSRQPMALVTDRHSRVVGLVTSEIVLEQILGRGLGR